MIVALHKHFPDKTWDELTFENCAALWDVLQANDQWEMLHANDQRELDA